MDVSRWKRWQTSEGTWRTIDVIAYALLIIGALSWGLVGFLGFDVMAALSGSMSVPLRLFFGLVGIAALYDLLSLPWIVKRWEIHMPHRPAHA